MSLRSSFCSQPRSARPDRSDPARPRAPTGPSGIGGDVSAETNERDAEHTDRRRGQGHRTPSPRMSPQPGNPPFPSSTSADPGGTSVI